jgi:hypothetical protein
MQPRRLVLIAFTALILGLAAAAQGTEVVWSGLVIAENAAQPERAPPELGKLEPTLKELFGYNQFQVIGQSRKPLKTGEEDWLASSKYFSLHVDARGGNDGDGYVLNLKLFQEKQMLLEWDTKLSKRSPLVIKGPQVGNGQLLLVLVVDDEDHKTQANETEHSPHHVHKQPNKLVSAWRYFTRKIRNAAP